MGRVLFIHMTSVGDTLSTSQALVYCDAKVSIDGESNILETTLGLTLNLKTAMGSYKTPIQLNQDLEDAVKDFMLDTHEIPTNGYAKVYISGAFDLLSLF